MEPALTVAPAEAGDSCRRGDSEIDGADVAVDTAGGTGGSDDCDGDFGDDDGEGERPVSGVGAGVGLVAAGTSTAGARDGLASAAARSPFVLEGKVPAFFKTPRTT
jgi:hypothetical protein